MNDELKREMRRLTSKDLILALHDAGRTPTEIAAAMEYEPSKVRRILELAGKTPNVWPPADFDRVREVDQMI